ncbi:MAG TPA: hypothetical protein VMT10_01900 [Solirubrobacteraceae bacterium]|nr:hypothetical protein [Solirubrobacteraceae bacterium]
MRPRLSTATSKPARRALRPHRAKRPSAPSGDAAPARLEPRVALQRRIRDAGGPEDHALYTCGCGCQFEADVSTGVACPHCGVEQNW